MTYLILSVLLWLWDNHSLVQISKNNRTRQAALTAYHQGNYGQAVVHYQTLIHSSLFIEPSARLNLAHSHYHLGQLDKARALYEQISHINQTDVAATALTQLGVIACQQGDTVQALDRLRKSLEISPGSEVARYNYELIKKRFSGRTPSTARRPAPARQTVASSVRPENEPTGGQEVERSEEKTELLRRLRALNLSEAQALQLLDAVQENEVLYIHQRKKASGKQPQSAYKQW